MLVTGVISEWAAQPFAWARWMGRKGFEDSDWPLETGGKETFRKILETTLKRPASRDESELQSAAFETLLAPERQRQRLLMKAAVLRMLELVYRR